MDRSYDIFEKLPDGALIWRAAVAGHENGILKLKEIAAQTKNEVRLMHIPDKTLIAVMNVPKP